jgi:hypothetical protein
MLIHLSLHRAILSETALRRLDISRSMHDPMGDVEKGHGGALTGRVWEAAFGRAITTALLETARGMERSRLDALLDAEAERHLAAGITACHDPCIPEELLPAMSRLAARTPLRVSWSHVSAHGILEAPMPRVATQPGGDSAASAKPSDSASRCALCLDPRVIVAMAETAVAQLVTRDSRRCELAIERLQRIFTCRISASRGRPGLAHRCLWKRGVREDPRLGNEAVAQACRALRGRGPQCVDRALVSPNARWMVPKGVVASLQRASFRCGPSLDRRGRD